MSYVYDLSGNRTSLITPSGTTTYGFDALNHLETVTHPGGGMTGQYDYDPAGWLANTYYPNGVVSSYTRDDLNRVVLLENRKSDTSLLSSFAYTLHPTGRRLQIVDHTGRTVDYAHDLLYRLESEDIQDAVLGDELIEYTYDPVGNRLTLSDSGGTTNHFYDANDRLLGDGANTYSYDSNGNPSPGPGHQALKPTITTTRVGLFQSLSQGATRLCMTMTPTMSGCNPRSMVSRPTIWLIVTGSMLRFWKNVTAWGR